VTTVKKAYHFGTNSRLKECRGDMYKTLEDKKLYMGYIAVDDVHTRYT
jgi:hypothetical protein